MSGAIARLVLQCPLCDHRPPENSVMEAYKLHCQVEHDTDDVTLELRAVCVCGAAMTLERTERISTTRDRDHFVCPACGKRGALRRGI